MSRRIFITLPDGIADQLDRWAKAENNKTASLAAWIVETTVRKATEEGKIPLEDTDEANNATRKFLSDIAEGNRPTDGNLFEAAHYLGVPAERLMSIRKKLFKEEETKNGF